MDIKHLASIPKTFFNKSSHDIAKGLLDCVLYTTHQQEIVGGRIVETEVYSFDDPSSHSFRGETPRNKAMFESAGTIYVYVSYGIHHCMNIVTEEKGVGSAVLIRAIEPWFGIPIMQVRRNQTAIKKLGTGPGCLTQALGISLLNNNYPIQFHKKNAISTNATTSQSTEVDTYSPVFLASIASSLINDNTIMVGPRIGISQSIDWPCRYFLKDNIFVSSHRQGKELSSS